MEIESTSFERAIFLSWFCGKGDCKFCYMSTQKELIREPKKAKRSFASLFAEVIITKACGWEVEFLSGGYESYSIDEIVLIAKTISKITGKKMWLNIGVLSEKELNCFLPYIEGFCGAVECVNPKIHDDVCPSKPVNEIEQTFRICEKLGLKKAMTLIIGIGETIDDFEYLKKFIIKNGVGRITFYSLNPQKGTSFKESPSIEYYEKWIKKTRDEFPTLKIIAGAWHDKTNYFSRLLLAGADNITKFPAIKYFGKAKAKEIERQAALAKRKFIGTFTMLPDIYWDGEVEKLDLDGKTKEKIKEKLNQYLRQMRKNLQET